MSKGKRTPKQPAKKTSLPDAKRSVPTTRTDNTHTTEETRRHFLAFHGPIPTPPVLEYYDQILPGAAERILVMAEKEGDHRRTIEKSIVDAECRLKNRGQWFALTFSLAALCVVGMAVYFDRTAIGTAVGVSTIVGVVGLFILGRKHGAKTEPGEPTEVSEPVPE